MLSSRAALLVALAAAAFGAACDSSSDSARANPLNAGSSSSSGYAGASSTSGSGSGDALLGSGPEAESGQKGAKVGENEFVDTAAEKTSTFGVDVDTASYTLMRSDINSGKLPAATTVRTEEMVNYFTYAYPQPTGEHPFSVNIDAAPSKFGENLHLLRIGLQGKNVTAAERKPINLVFLVDVSGSMSDANKLPLVQYTLKHLVEQLRATDTLGIVTYAGNAGTLLEPESVTNKSKILAAIDALSAGGGTNGAGGIARAYELAEKNKSQYNESRVVLCTDGDFNLGTTGDALVALIEKEREKGVTLTALGYGRGNYNDAQLEGLANKGNGNYAYIDNALEAQRVIGFKLTGTLQVIAKDVKIQLELDPTFVSRYRLVGYENRVLANADFTNDKKDAGEIGAGHSVTAFYELELTPAAKAGTAQGNLAKVKLRYKQPQGTVSTELDAFFATTAIAPTFEAASTDFRFGASVVELAEILRGSKHSTGLRFDDIVQVATSASTLEDADRQELISLTKSAKTLWK